MNNVEIANKIIAGIISLSLGVIAFLAVYIGLGLILQPLNNWIPKQVFMRR